MRDVTQKYEIISATDPMVIAAMGLTPEIVISEIKSLAGQHWQELADNRDIYDLDVDWNMYLAVWRAGHLHITEVRECGALIGYHVVTYRRHPHNKGLVADDAVSFIRPDIEGRVWVLMEMFKYSIAALTAIGVRYFRFRVKTRRDFGAMLRRMGFEATEIGYTMTVRD